MPVIRLLKEHLNLMASYTYKLLLRYYGQTGKNNISLFITISRIYHSFRRRKYSTLGAELHLCSKQ